MKRFNRFLDLSRPYRLAAADAVRKGLGVTNAGGGVFKTVNRAAADGTGMSRHVGANTLAGVWVVGRLTLQGVRCVAPTLAQLEALGHTDLTLPWSDYRQPFDTFAVALPDDAPPAGEDVPRPAVCTLALDRAAGVFAMTLDGDDLESTPLLNIFAYDPAIEVCSLLRAESEDIGGEASEALKWYTRAAMNCCLLLAAYPAVRLGPANPGYAARLDRSLEKKRLPDAVRAANAAARRDIPDVYAFSQEVLFRPRREADPDAPDPTPTGREMPCHWRRGHWANVACGEGRSGRRLVFRPPVMVRADRFGGPPAGSSVTYRLPG